MRRRALLVSAPLATVVGGLGACSREVAHPSWIVSAAVGTPRPPVLWVLVAQGSVREARWPSLTGADTAQRTMTDIRLQPWLVDLSSGQQRPLRVLPLEDVGDASLQASMGEWPAAGLTLSVRWHDGEAAQTRWWHYPAGRVELRGKAGHWRPLPEAPQPPSPADEALWARLSATHDRDTVDLLLDRGRERVRVLQLDAQGQPVWLPPARPLPQG